MKNIFLVGGAVRDLFLGIESKDLDFCVVGSTPEEMLANGYEQVGNQFPVFLHPVTKDEYALARKDKKIAPGYNGFQFDFSPTVTLSDDQYRRDFTINSMALPVIFQPIERKNWIKEQLIDPLNGLEDLKNKLIRHVNKEAFSDDPVRVLRGARFAARYDFYIHEDTFDLMMTCVENEFMHLTSERVWKEFEKGLSEPHFYKMLEILNQLDAFKILGFPINYDYSIKNILTTSKINDKFKEIILFCLISKNFILEDFKNWKIPNSFSDMSNTWNKLQWSNLIEYDFEKILNLIEKSGILKNQDKKEMIFNLLSFYFPSSIIEKFDNHIKLILQIDNKSIIGNEKDGSKIKQKIFLEKLRILQNM